MSDLGTEEYALCATKLKAVNRHLDDKAMNLEADIGIITALQRGMLAGTR